MGRHGKLLLGCLLAAVSVLWAALLEESACTRGPYAWAMGGGAESGLGASYLDCECKRVKNALKSHALKTRHVVGTT